MQKRFWQILPFIIICLTFLGVCAGGADPEPQLATRCAAAPYEAVGPHPVSVRTLDMDGVTTEVWFPAAPPTSDQMALDSYDMRDWLPAETRAQIPADAPTQFGTGAFRDGTVSSEGPFPIVLFSHGFGGYRMQSSFLMTHLASWGFIVVAPEHAERNMTTVLQMGSVGDASTAQIQAAFEFLRAGALPDTADLAAAGDFDSVFLMGHSAGGAPVQNLVDDPSFNVTAWAGLATVAYPSTPTVPGLVLAGDSDAIATRALVTGAYEDLPARPKRFINIAGAGHLAFSDICAIGRERGGILNIAVEAGLDIPPLVQQLATDGCRQENLPAEEGWPIINHYVTAHFLSALSDTETGLDSAAEQCFGDRIFDARHQL